MPTATVLARTSYSSVTTFCASKKTKTKTTTTATAVIRGGHTDYVRGDDAADDESSLGWGRSCSLRAGFICSIYLLLLLRISNDDPVDCLLPFPLVTLLVGVGGSYWSTTHISLRFSGSSRNNNPVFRTRHRDVLVRASSVDGDPPVEARCRRGIRTIVVHRRCGRGPGHRCRHNRPLPAVVLASLAMANYSDVSSETVAHAFTAALCSFWTLLTLLYISS
jgi:hypothetical protein